MADADDNKFALVVDDDPLICMAAADILEDAGFSVFEANSVTDALQLLEQASERIVLLCTDVQMPPSDLTGFDLAQKCARRFPHIGILVASGQATPKPGDLPDGAVFMCKPFSADVVREHLQKVLSADDQPDELKR